MEEIVRDVFEEFYMAPSDAIGDIPEPAIKKSKVWFTYLKPILLLIIYRH